MKTGTNQPAYRPGISRTRQRSTVNRSQRTPAPRGAGWLSRQYRQRPKPLWMVLTADLLLIVLSLLVFALFHHVLPRREKSVGAVSSREAAGAQAVIAVNDKDDDEASEDDGSAVSIDLNSMTSDDVSMGEDYTDEVPAVATEDTDAAPSDEGADDSGAEGQDDEDGATVASTAAFSLTDVPGYFGDKFADKFTDGQVIKSKSGYQSENVNITLARYSSDHAVFYVADIYLRDISNLVTAFAKDTFGQGTREWATTICKNINGIIAINGDYYGGRSDGIVIRNGELYRSDKYPNRDVCVLFWDGTMETYGTSAFDAQAAINAGAYQAWNFGPRLLDSDGKAKTKFNSDVGPTNPRTALGYFEPGHYCFVVVDGRQEGSSGLTLKELAALMQELGCVRAYNMDGGNTSVMVAGGTIVNNPSGGGRPTTDIIAIVDN